MSNTQFAFIKRESVPDRAALQASLDALGFDLRLDPEFTPFEDEGFLPFTLKGEEGPGYEVYYEEASDICEEDEELAALADGKDVCISMVWRSSMKDLACVMMVSCAYAKDFGAVISYEGNEPETVEGMLAALPGILKESRGES